MRIDKYLKTARILKRREAAKELALANRVWVNGRLAKPSSEIQEGDLIKLAFGNRILEIRVLEIRKQVSKADASLLFEVVSETRTDPAEASAAGVMQKMPSDAGEEK